MEWVTLRRAAEHTHIPVSTIRNWARKEKIPTRLANEPVGLRRMVGLGEVVTRARQLGRLPTTNGEGAGSVAQPSSAEAVMASPQASVTEADTVGEGHAQVPEGHMLVPLDAWEKMLMQLGNLHAAGQELAEARERAAKAETEAQFLRERVADLRQSRDQLLAGAGTTPGTVPRQAATPQPHSWYRWLISRLRDGR